MVFPSTLIFYPVGRHLTGRVSFRWEIMWDNGWRWNISLQKFTEQMSEIVTKIFSILFEQRKTLCEEIFLEALTIFWPKTILERSGVWNLHFRFEGEDVKTVTEGISKFINDVSLEKIELHFQRWRNQVIFGWEKQSMSRGGQNWFCESGAWRKKYFCIIWVPIQDSCFKQLLFVFNPGWCYPGFFLTKSRKLISGKVRD